LKKENEALRQGHGLRNDQHGDPSPSGLQADAQLGFPSDEIVSAFMQERTSPLAPSDHEFLMQHPFDVARITISELLTSEDQGLLYVIPFRLCCSLTAGM